MHEKRRFVEAAGRTTLGTFVAAGLLLAIAYGVYNALEIVGTTNDSEEEKGKEKYKSGISDDSIKIGKYRYKYSNNSLGYSLKMMVNLIEQWNRPGTTGEKIAAASRRLGMDILESNPFTDDYTGRYEHKNWSSEVGSRLSQPIPRALQEAAEIIDDKPRRFFDDGFGSQFLIKIPYLREYLPEADSYPGGLDQRGDGWRRVLRLASPIEWTEEKQPQSSLSNTPLSKYSDPKPLKEKLKSEDTDGVLKFYKEYKDRFKPEELNELQKILQKKANNANEKGTLTPEEKQRIEKAFPDLQIKKSMPSLPSMKSMPSKFDEE